MLSPETCTDNDARSRDGSTPCWRESHEDVIGEMVAVRGQRGEVLVTLWDTVDFFAGGHHGCDGSVESMRRPLAREGVLLRKVLRR